jgi:hypothetical protein
MPSLGGILRGAKSLASDTGAVLREQGPIFREEEERRRTKQATNAFNSAFMRALLTDDQQAMQEALQNSSDVDPKVVSDAARAMLTQRNQDRAFQQREEQAADASVQRDLDRAERSIDRKQTANFRDRQLKATEADRLRDDERASERDRATADFRKEQLDATKALRDDKKESDDKKGEARLRSEARQRAIRRLELEGLQGSDLPRIFSEELRAVNLEPAASDDRVERAVNFIKTKPRGEWGKLIDEASSLSDTEKEEIRDVLGVSGGRRKIGLQGLLQGTLQTGSPFLSAGINLRNRLSRN